MIQDPPGPTSVKEECNYDQECVHIKSFIFNKYVPTDFFQSFISNKHQRKLKRQTRMDNPDTRKVTINIKFSLKKKKKETLQTRHRMNNPETRNIRDKTQNKDKRNTKEMTQNRKLRQ